VEKSQPDNRLGAQTVAIRCSAHSGERNMAKRPSLGDFLTNLDQPMPLHEKLSKLTRNLWRRVALRQSCCGNYGEPGC